MNQTEEIKFLRSIFKEIRDPRDSRGKRHYLLDIIVISVFGILCGCTDFEDIVIYAKGNINKFEKYLDLWNGIPSAKTFREVFQAIDAEEFLECFMKWVKTIIPNSKGQHIAIDGKAIRAATEKMKKGNVPYIVNAYMAGVGITISQVKVDEKSNEITAIPSILDMIAMEGAIITIDAMGTQEKIMNKIIENKGDFVLPVKGNQKNAHKAIIEHFDQINLDKTHNIDTSTTSENGHGRTETRICTVSSFVDWLNCLPKWQHVKSVAMTTNTREINGVKSTQIKYYVLSDVLSANEVLKITRNHWQIENNLHWTLDVAFKEDLSRGRKGDLMENFSLLRKLCLNIIKKDDRFGNISIKKKMCHYKFCENELEELIFDLLPNMQF